MTHGPWLNGETLGLPKGLNLKPASILELLGLAPAAPGTGCDFGVCVPIGNGIEPASATIGAIACLSDPVCAALAVVGSAAVLVAAGYNIWKQTRSKTKQPELPSGDCVRVSTITEGTWMKCFYECPRPNGTVVEKWKYSTITEGCPEVENESKLRTRLDLKEHILRDNNNLEIQAFDYRENKTIGCNTSP